MFDDEGKDKKPALAVQRSKPTFVTVGNRQILSSGRWNDDAMAEWLLLHGRDRWVPIGELAGVAYGNKSPRMKIRVRQCMAGLFRALLKFGEFLVVEYNGPHGAASAVKLYDEQSEQDRQAQERKLTKMRQRRELSDQQYELAIAILLRKRAA